MLPSAFGAENDRLGSSLSRDRHPGRAIRPLGFAKQKRKWSGPRAVVGKIITPCEADNLRTTMVSVRRGGDA